MRYGSTSALRDSASVVGTIEAYLRGHSNRFSGLASQSGMLGTGLTHDGAQSVLYSVSSNYSVASDKAGDVSSRLLATATLIEELNTEAAQVEAEIKHDNLLQSIFNINESRLDMLDQLAADARQNLARQLRNSVKNDVVYTKAEPSRSWWYYLPSAFPDAVKQTAGHVRDGFVDGFLAVPKIAVGLYERSAVNYFVDRDEFNRKWQETEGTVNKIGQAYDQLGPKQFFLTMGKEIIKNPAYLAGNVLGGLAFGEVVSTFSQVATAARVTASLAEGPADEILSSASGQVDDLVRSSGSLVDDFARFSADDVRLSPVDLLKNEGRVSAGGMQPSHVIEEHIGKSADELFARFPPSGTLPSSTQVSSSFANLEKANILVNKAISAKATEVASFLSDSSQTSLRVIVEMSESTGLVVTKSGASLVGTKVTIILRKGGSDGVDLIVHSAYPSL